MHLFENWSIFESHVSLVYPCEGRDGIGQGGVCVYGGGEGLPVRNQQWRELGLHTGEQSGISGKTDSGTTSRREPPLRLGQTGWQQRAGDGGGQCLVPVVGSWGSHMSGDCRLGVKGPAGGLAGASTGCVVRQALPDVTCDGCPGAWV